MADPKVARWEITRGDDKQWWARFRAANGKLVCYTEKYRRRVDAVKAVGLVAGYPVNTDHAGRMDVAAPNGVLVEVRDVTKEDVG